MNCFCTTTERAKLVELIQQHQGTKKNFEIQDAYKLIYQGVFGVEHILDNPQIAKKHLELELESVIGSDTETLIENISVSGEIVRINLHPYKYRNGDIEKLFEAMVHSAEKISGSQKRFLALWNEFMRAVFKGQLNFGKEQLIIFDNKVKSDDYPAMHHSSAYREANQPAYRVLKSNFAQQLLSRP
ncbi:MAG: hypothetical protein JSW07_15860 [bacterium]|nr:MAG: hypothetical protein JSW07_15860 [bacterium]